MDGPDVLIHHHTIPVRVPARRAFSAAVGDAEQQPLVGFNSFLARSPAISCIPLASFFRLAEMAQPNSSMQPPIPPSEPVPPAMIAARKYKFVEDYGDIVVKE